MKLLRHLLCLGILLGLAGNGIAAAEPCILMPQNRPVAMADMPDCDMVQPNSTSHESDKSKALGCMAMIACAAALAIKEPAATAADQHRAPAAKFWPTATILVGRDLAPEQEPPTFLG